MGVKGLGIKAFEDVFRDEIKAINQRRGHHQRSKIELEVEDTQRDKTPILRPALKSNLVGLSLSGGGIRSAAFSLGVLQALDDRGLIEKIDYLSSVSGGGYIGLSMTAAMSESTPEQFPFASKLQAGEEPGVQHIRDHSNYLFPQGALNLFANLVVCLRGIVVNIVMLLSPLLIAAALTIFCYPDSAALDPDKAGTGGDFEYTLLALLIFVALLALWGLWRSSPMGRRFSDVGFGARSFGIFLVILLGLAFVQLQPWLLYGFFQADKAGGFFPVAAKWFKVVVATLAPLSAVVGLFGNVLADVLKRTNEKPGFGAFAGRVAIKLAMYLAGAAVPLVLWLVYLYLSFWGIADNSSHHTPDWLQSLAQAVPYCDGSIRCLYFGSGILLFVIGFFFFNPNANSLHRLYRDRLAKAFLFDPNQRQAASAWKRLRGQTGDEADAALRGSDLKPLDGKRISELTTERAPYHLINTALNIEDSKYANRRGRNADFFIFSPKFTGSEATGYVETTEMEKSQKGLTIGTAMAASGAAASSNMGSATIKPLVPTLAILNVRLGYWLSNPAAVAGALKRALILRFLDSHLYFLKEMFGLLTEDSQTVLVTDGGHIENLGMYELLRRRCKLIIAVDAEADPDMSFGSLVTLERYARIDFGLRIDLPWASLRDTTRKASADILNGDGMPPDQAKLGPHCALGTIYYPRKDGEKTDDHNTGVLLYVKSSFTGDENDYILDYKRRNSDFPHETTLDQLFTEEQFEAYRALGFHAVNSAFKCTDVVAMKPDPAKWQGPATTILLEKRMREILGLPCSAPAPQPAR
jgi:hypothetical protein